MRTRSRSPPMVLALPTLFVVAGMALVGAGTYYYTRSLLVSALVSLGVFLGELVMLVLTGLGYGLDKRRRGR